jgi:3-oxoacyl-[acyl-carrier protein] reductase
MKFENKVAVVTGGTRGIGYRIATKLASEGANVITLSKSGRIDNKSESGNQGGASKGNSIWALKADVSVKKEVDHAFQQVFEKFGQIDILVNNAGVFENGGIMEVTEQQWDRMLAVNLKGVIFCCQAVYQKMAARKYGKIINIASIAGRMSPMTRQIHYSVSKAGVITLTRCLARELASYNVNVNGIAPAITNTSISDQQSETDVKELVKIIPLGRMAVPEDTANAVAFLASEEAAFITGEVINVDGGRLMD